MVKPLLARIARKNIENSSSINRSGNNACTTSPVDQDPASNDGKFSYADAEKLSEMLIEQSRRSKSGLFKQERPRRPIHIRRAFSDGCLLKDGIEAPTSTPEMPFLSRYPSTKSTTSTLHGSVEIGPHISRISLTPTCSTMPDMDVKPSNPVLASTDRFEAVEIKPSGSITTPKESDPLLPLPRNQSFSIGSNLIQAKKWGKNVLQEIKAPLRRHKTRQGKLPALEVAYQPHVPAVRHQAPKEMSERVFTNPSSSQQFQSMKLQGGAGPPKYLSEQTLNKLDQLDREHERMRREIARLEKGREELLKCAHVEDIKERDKQRKEGKDKDLKRRPPNLVRASRNTDNFSKSFVI
jgi:hypothetical protein